jgi:hypothetical protein
MSVEPGLDLHDWETRWQQLRDEAADSPFEALPELVRLAEQMLEESGYAEGGDPDVIRNLTAAREVAAACDAGTAEPGDVGQAIENLTELHDFLVQHRAAP